MNGRVRRQPPGTGDDGSSQPRQGDVSATVIIDENTFEAAASIRVEHRKPLTSNTLLTIPLTTSNTVHTLFPDH